MATTGGGPTAPAGTGGLRAAPQVTVRFWAGARAAAGTAAVEVPVEGPVALAALQQELVRRLGGQTSGARSRLADVLASCSVLLGDQPVGAADRAEVVVAPGGTVEFLPPFAGG